MVETDAPVPGTDTLSGRCSGYSGTAQTCQQARPSDSLASGKGIEGQAGWEQERDKVHKSSSESTCLTLDSATAI